MSALAVGLDVVGVPSFVDQLADGASGFAEATFTRRELRDARAEDMRRDLRLAARFAAKEAFLKAWSSARAGRPPALAGVDLRQIEVADDGWGRPRLALHGEVADALDALGAELGLSGPPRAHLSLSHDWPVAAAVVVLEGP